MAENPFLSKSKVLQVFSTLSGLIEGVSADNIIKKEEVAALRNWLETNRKTVSRPPFSEVVNVIENSLADDKITEEELHDIRYVCKNVISTFGQADDIKIQNLHGIASGIASDGLINSDEWSYLDNWIDNNPALKGTWPFDEIQALTKKHKKFEKISPSEMEIIVHYLNDFSGLNQNKTLTHPLNEPSMSITEICAECKDIQLKGKTFCITGESIKYSRAQIKDILSEHDGFFKSNISKSVDYLIVCSDGSPYWKFSCYGRKVEAAIALKKSGSEIEVINEVDLWATIENYKKIN